MLEGLSLLRQAVEALLSLALNSHAATAFVACVALVLTLEAIRSRRGPEVNFFRLLAVGAIGLIVGSYLYGDFLAPPAGDAWADFTAAKDRLLPFVTIEHWFIVAAVAFIVFLLGLRRTTAVRETTALARSASPGVYPRNTAPINLRSSARRGPRTVITPTGTTDLVELRLLARNAKKRIPSSRRIKRNTAIRNVQR